MTIAPEKQKAIAGVGAVVLFLILFWPAPTPFVPYLHPLASAAATLKGAAPPSDLAQDIVGFRALIRHDNPYPMLGPAVETLGLNWPVEHVSTHPPTAFLLVAPIAMFPWPLAAMIWAWLMLGCLAIAFRLWGLPWLAALGLAPIALLWPPVATSLGQFTIIWLLGVGLAYNHERDNCFLSGLGIGLAALPKFLPGLTIVLFLSKPRRRAIAWAASVALASLAILQFLFPGSLERYAQANRLNAIAMVGRTDNASLPGAAYRLAGGWGIVAVVGFLALILWANRGALDPRRMPFPSTTLWMVVTYASVTLLPVSWIYSLTPLLPVIVFLIAKRTVASLAIGVTCVSLPFVFPIWGPSSVAPLVLVNILIGVGLIVQALPSRTPAAPSKGERRNRRRRQPVSRTP
jgi:hypothetical protein